MLLQQSLILLGASLIFANCAWKDCRGAEGQKSADGDRMYSRSLSSSASSNESSPRPCSSTYSSSSSDEDTSESTHNQVERSSCLTTDNSFVPSLSEFAFPASDIATANVVAAEMFDETFPLSNVEATDGHSSGEYSEDSILSSHSERPEQVYLLAFPQFIDVLMEACMVYEGALANTIRLEYIALQYRYVDFLVLCTRYPLSYVLSQLTFRQQGSMRSALCLEYDRCCGSVLTLSPNLQKLITFFSEMRFIWPAIKKGVPQSRLLNGAMKDKDDNAVVEWLDEIWKTHVGSLDTMWSLLSHEFGTPLKRCPLLIVKLAIKYLGCQPLEPSFSEVLGLTYTIRNRTSASTSFADLRSFFSGFSNADILKIVWKIDAQPTTP